MAGDRSVVTRFRVEYNQAVQGLQAVGTAASKTSQEVDRAGGSLEAASRKQADAAGKLRVAETQLDEAKRKHVEGSSRVVSAEEKVARARREVETATENATQAQRDYKSAMDNTSKGSGGVFADLAQGARDNEQAWTKAGGAIAGAGAAITGLQIASMKSGIEFNSLQQTSRAALTSVMDSAGGAARQMDRLHSFGRETWVMRDSLLRAQQTMAGFGIETQKVVPYLGALAEGVAATSASNQDFEELARVMGKVNSSGKITAETFNEFGTRGVDAAELIGSQMDMTAGQVREAVTDGALDAGDALDALAAGMEERYAGATEKVRNTFRGSVDDMAAAWRGLSSAMAEPLVGPDSGGALVGGLQVATETMYALTDVVEDMPGWLKLVTGGIVGVGGAASLAAGGFLLFLPRIQETQAAFQALSGQQNLVGKATRGLGKMTPVLKGVAGAAAIAGATLAALHIADQIFPREDIARADEYAKALGRVTEGGKAYIDAINEIGNFDAANDFLGTDDVNDFGDALERVADPTTMDNINKSLEWISPWGSSFGEMEDKVNEVNLALANMVDEGNAAEAARIFEAIREANPDIPFDRLVELMPDYISAAEEAGSASEDAAGGIATLSGEAVEAQEELQKLYEGLAESGQGFIDFATDAKDSEIGLQEWIKTLEDQVVAQEEWFDNLSALIDRGAPQELIDQLMELGPEGATRVKELADASDEDLGRVVDAFTEGRDAAEDFADSVTGIPPVNLDADPTELKGQVWIAKQELRELEEEEPSPVIDAQIVLLEDKIRLAEEQLGDLDDEEAHPLVGVSGADTSRGKVEGVHEALLEADGESAEMTVEADVSEAEGSISGFFSRISEKWTTFWDGRREALQNDPSAPGQASQSKGRSGSSSAFFRGGSVIGPGTGTSDDILTRLSNGEHVWTAKEVDAVGGQAQVYRLRNMVRNGELQEMIPGFATGGAVGAAESRLESAQSDLDRLRRSKRELTPEQRRQEARENQAQRKIDRARAALDRAKEEEARRERVESLRMDMKTDLRRGSIRDRVTSGESGAYSIVDQMMNLANDENLGGGARRIARRSSGRFESDLRRLYSQAESVEEKLKAAQDKARELEGIQDRVASGISRQAYSLDTSSHWAQTSGGEWEQTVGVSGARTNAAFAAGRVKELAQKLNKLQGMGYGGAILQEVAGAGSIEESILMADALLQGSSSDVSSLNASYADIEKYSRQAGQFVSAGFYEGGADAARGIVSGLESEQATIERKIEQIAKSMEDVFKRVLGIRSPSTLMASIGQDAVAGLRLGLMDGEGGIREASDLLAQAVVPNMAYKIPAPTLGDQQVGRAPVAGGDVEPANGSIEDMSAVTLEALETMRQAVSEGYSEMSGVTGEHQGLMREATTVNQGLMQEATTVNQGLMRDETTARQTEMTGATQLNQSTMLTSTEGHQLAMRETITLEQAQMLANVRARQAEMLESTRSNQSAMNTSTRENFTTMRVVGSEESSIMRGNVVSTMVGMRTDHSSQLSTMQTRNREGFEEMRRSGVDSFTGLRTGMGNQMTQAQPELVSDLNRLIGEFGRFTSSVNAAFGDVGVDLSSPTRLATGGVLPGYTPGRDVHHFRSPSGGDLYLSGGEAIMRPEFTQAMGGEEGIRQLNALARNGRPQDLSSSVHTGLYASGGVLPRIDGVTAFRDSGVWRSLFGAVQERFPNVNLHSAYRAGSRTAGSGNASYHSLGKAIDISPRMDIANWIRENFGGGTAELIFSPMNGRQIHKGRNHMYTGITRSMHFDHIHWAVERMLQGVMPYTGDGTYSGGAPVHPFLDRANVSAGSDLAKSYREAAQKLMKGILQKHTGALSDMNPFMQDLGSGIMKATQPGLIEKAEEYGDSMKFVMPGGEGVARWRDTVIQALRYAGLPQTDDYVGAWLRQIQSESGGNPNIMQQIRDVNSGGNEAQGLVQVIPGTFAAFRDKSLPNDRTHPLANLVAGMNWAKYKASRQGRDMLSFIGHGHGYEQGTKSAQRGLAIVGEDGPEVVDFEGGERVYSNPETRKFFDIQANPQMGPGIDYDRLAQAMAKVLPQTDVAAALNGAQMTLNVDGKAMTGFVQTAVASGYNESKSRLTRSSRKVGAP